MSIGNTSKALDLLNGATAFVADVASGGSQHLVVGGVYTLQALSSDTYFGFGATSAAAITDAGSGAGEKLVADAPARVVEIQSDAVAFVSGSGGTLRVRKAADPT
jgi:hypothetical protein